MSEQKTCIKFYLKIVCADAHLKEILYRWNDNFLHTCAIKAFKVDIEAVEHVPLPHRPSTSATIENIKESQAASIEQLSNN